MQVPFRETEHGGASCLPFSFTTSLPFSTCYAQELLILPPASSETKPRGKDLQGLAGASFFSLHAPKCTTLADLRAAGACLGGGQEVWPEGVQWD